MNNFVKALIGILLIGLISFGVYWLVVNRDRFIQDGGQTTSSSSTSSIQSSATSSNSSLVRSSSSSVSSSVLPKLSNFTPQDGYETTETTATLKGQVDAGTKVFVDGVETVVDDSQKFVQDVPLKNGENQVILSLKNSNGAETKQVLTYTRSDSIQSSSSMSPQVEIINPSSSTPAVTNPTSASSNSSSSSVAVSSSSSSVVGSVSSLSPALVPVVTNSVSSSQSLSASQNSLGLSSSIPPVKPLRTGGLDGNFFLSSFVIIVLAYFGFKILSLSWNKKI